MHVDGGGLVRGSHLYFHAENCTIDAGGILSSGTVCFTFCIGPVNIA